LSGNRTGLAGVGIGLVSVPRFERAVDRFGDRLLRRFFRPAELEYAGRKRTGIQSLAVRLAAKWAGRRALALSGITLPVRALEVVRPPGREPTLEVLGVDGFRLSDRDLRFSITLTHDADFALASVWLERAGGDA
jgi:holo-[acyl-carrier protein] synthase